MNLLYHTLEYFLSYYHFVGLILTTLHLTRTQIETLVLSWQYFLRFFGTINNKVFLTSNTREAESFSLIILQFILII